MRPVLVSHNASISQAPFSILIAVNPLGAKGRQRRVLAGSDGTHCTKSGHVIVDGLHSIENPCTYGRVFFVDWKTGRSTTRSFFDSFLSFSGWCSVRGSSEVTFLIARLGRRVSKGL